MSLHVIGAGFGRTGTLSLKVALEKLGYDRTHHMEDVLPSPKQVRLWHDVASGKNPRWDQIFDGFQASVDFPSSTYYRELLAHYPDAKVVLTTRDVDAWYSSAAATIYPVTQLTPSWAMRFVPHVRRMHEMTNGTVWDRIFHGRFSDEAFAKQVFVDYIDEVQRNVPADQLLVFNVAQGWAPLCAFLDREIPDSPFPHENDTKSFQSKIWALKALRLVPYVGAALVVVAAALFSVM